MISGCSVGDCLVVFINHRTHCELAALQFVRWRVGVAWQRSPCMLVDISLTANANVFEGVGDELILSIPPVSDFPESQGG